jgi:hypothetical protein
LQAGSQAFRSGHQSDGTRPHRSHHKASI